MISFTMLRQLFVGLVNVVTQWCF